MILMMGANFGAGRIASEANVGSWHKAEVQGSYILGPVTAALPTFGRECRHPGVWRCPLGLLLSARKQALVLEMEAACKGRATCTKNSHIYQYLAEFKKQRYSNPLF